VRVPHAPASPWLYAYNISDEFDATGGQTSATTATTAASAVAAAAAASAAPLMGVHASTDKIRPSDEETSTAREMLQGVERRFPHITDSGLTVPTDAGAHARTRAASGERSRR